MKLNKPKVTDNQTELESYVESLLKEHVDPIPTADSKVTPLRSKKTRAQDSQPDSRPVNTDISLSKSKKNRYIEESLSPSESRAGDDAESLVQHSSINEPHKPNASEEDIATAVESEQVDPVALKGNADSFVINAGRLKAPAVSAEQKTTPQDKELSKPSNKMDATQQHHEKITKEFKAYQESTHAKIPEPDPRLQNVEKLLSRIALASVVSPANQSDSKTTTDLVSETKITSDASGQESQAVSSEVAEASFLHRDAKPMKELLGDVFQTLVFEVHKLPLAVPLVKLGGIVNFSEEDVTPLVGTPDWFLGLVPNERGNLMVVDTQKFLMPEKAPSEPSAYEYLIVLDNSNWALACHAVNDAKNLAPEDIRWSARSSKRPWFAGMVVEYMSALVEVDELINMLAENVVE